MGLKSVVIAMDAASKTMTRVVQINNRLGLHARPAMSFADIANSFVSDIYVRKGQQVVDAKSIMQLMMLAAGKGTQLQIEATGSDAAEAITALCDLVMSNFDEN